MAKPKKSRKQTLIFNGIFMLISVVALELIFGGWLGHRRLHELSIVRNRDHHKDVSDLTGEKKTIHYRRDQHGLRGDYGSPSQIDILTLGGSTTDQRAIGEGSTWQDLVVKSFKEKGKTLRIANAGVDGQCSFGHILMFDNWAPTVPKLKTKYVLVYAGVNDFYWQGGDHPDDPQGWFHTIEKNSIVYHVFRTIRGMLRVRYDYTLLGHVRVDLAKKNWTDKASRSDYATLMEKRRVAYHRRLVSLAKRIKTLGAQPIFVSQVFSAYYRDGGKITGLDEEIKYEGHIVNGVDVYHMFGILNETMMDACKASGGVCIDLASEIDFKPSDFYDYVHPNNQGTQKLADYFTRKLTPIF
jgi:lysophospholipase L1-like esterase